MEETKIIKTEGRKGSLIWLSPLAAGLILTIMFKAAHRFPGDSHIFLVADYYIQFIDYIVMFWRKLFSGNGLFYSFDLGMGAATWEHYSFYGFSPFNFIFLIIKDSDTAAYCLYLLKVCSIAFCMHLYLIYGMKVRDRIAVLFSVPYALCSFVICFYSCIIFFDYLFILPLVMLMMIRFFRTGKAGGLSAVYSYSFIASYYGGYMIGVFSFVCFVVMLISGKYSVSKKRLFMRYIAGVTVAILISAVVTLPSAIAILSGMGGESSNVLSLNLHLYDVLEAIYPFAFIDVYSLKPAIYCGLITLISVIGYYHERAYGIKEKITASVPIIFLLICTFFKPAHLMIHGFDEPDGYYFRFAFIFCFYLSTVGARWLEEKKAGIIIFPFILVSGLEAFLIIKKVIFPAADQDGTFAVTSSIIMLLIFLYFIAIKECSYVFMGGILSAELLMSGYFCLTPDVTSIDRWRESYDLLNNHNEQAFTEIADTDKEDADDQFYRVNYRYGLWANDGMFFGYHGLGYFSSMEQRNVRRALKNLGYATSERVVEDKGGSPFTEMIFAQKYKVLANPDITDSDCEIVDVKKNECFLPIAFAVSDEIKDYKTGENPFENQQSLLNSMLGHKITIWEEYTENASLNFYNATIETIDDGRYRVRRIEPGKAMMEFEIKADEEEDYYIYVSTRNNGLREEAPVVYSDVEDDRVGQLFYSYIYMPATIRMGNSDGKSTAYIEIMEDGDEMGFFDKAFFASYKTEGLHDAYKELVSGGIKIYEMKDDDINGYVNMPKDKSILFTSIPYDKNWHIQSDGEEIETFPVLDGAFLACRLPEGEHNLNIYYDNGFIRLGTGFSLVGILLLIGIMISDRRNVSDPIA